MGRRFIYFHGAGGGGHLQLFRGAGEQAFIFWDSGSLPKSKTNN